MITDYKITEIFCAVDEFCKEFVIVMGTGTWGMRDKFKFY